MNDIFEFIGKPNSPRINLQFRTEDSNDKIWHRNTEKYGIECKFIVELLDVKAKITT